MTITYLIYTFFVFERPIRNTICNLTWLAGGLKPTHSVETRKSGNESEQRKGHSSWS